MLGWPKCSDLDLYWYYPSLMASGKPKPVISVFFFLRPAQKDLPGLAVFPCAVVGRETGRESAAKAT